MGTKDVPLEDKTLTVVYGADLCNVNFINFTTNSRDTAQVSHQLLEQKLTLKVLVVTIDAQWEGMGGWRGTSRHYFPHARP